MHTIKIVCFKCCTLRAILVQNIIRRNIFQKSHVRVHKKKSRLNNSEVNALQKNCTNTRCLRGCGLDDPVLSELDTCKGLKTPQDMYSALTNLIKQDPINVSYLLDSGFASDISLSHEGEHYRLHRFMLEFAIRFSNVGKAPSTGGPVDSTGAHIVAMLNLIVERNTARADEEPLIPASSSTAAQLVPAVHSIDHNVDEFVQKLSALQVTPLVMQHYLRALYDPTLLRLSHDSIHAVRALRYLVCAVIVLRKLKLDSFLESQLDEFFIQRIWPNGEKTDALIWDVIEACVTCNANSDDEYLTTLVVRLLAFCPHTLSDAKFERLAKLTKDAGKFFSAIAMCTLHEKKVGNMYLRDTACVTIRRANDGMTAISDACVRFVRTSILKLKNAWAPRTENDIRIELPPPNITIRMGDKTYEVHDFILYQWSYFGRLMAAGMAEAEQRTIEFNAEFPHQALLVILAVLYGCNLNDSLHCGDALISNMTDNTARFILEHAEEYELLPFRHAEAASSSDDGAINAVKATRSECIFESLCEFCATRVNKTNLLKLMLPPMVEFSAEAQRMGISEEQVERFAMLLHNVSGKHSTVQDVPNPGVSHTTWGFHGDRENGLE